jgi:hypothetical protein
MMDLQQHIVLQLEERSDGLILKILMNNHLRMMKNLKIRKNQRIFQNRRIKQSLKLQKILLNLSRIVMNWLKLRVLNL